MSIPDLLYPINFLDDGSVVTRDGEYLGTWTTDESDAIYEFTPDGAIEPLFDDVFKGALCRTIREWHDSRG
jgi:hypothetical protein